MDDLARSDDNLWVFLLSPVSAHSTQKRVISTLYECDKEVNTVKDTERNIPINSLYK